MFQEYIATNVFVERVSTREIPHAHTRAHTGGG